MLAIVLMPLNLLCESLKLYYKLHTELKLSQLVCQVCKGFAVNLFFPFGLGSYIGRSMNVEKKCREQIITVTTISSLSQTVLNLLFGAMLGRSLFMKLLPVDKMQFQNSWWISLSIIFFCVFGVSVFTKTKNPQVIELMAWIKKKSQFDMIPLSGMDWLVYGGLSFLRYVIYLAQGVLIVISFPGIAWSDAVCSMALFFMILSLFYLPGLLTVLSRSAIACLVFSLIGLNNEQSLHFSWFIFLLNVVLPAMFGIYYMFEDTIQTKWENLRR